MRRIADISAKGLRGWVRRSTVLLFHLDVVVRDRIFHALRAFLPYRQEHSLFRPTRHRVMYEELSTLQVFKKLTITSRSSFVPGERKCEPLSVSVV